MICGVNPFWGVCCVLGGGGGGGRNQSPRFPMRTHTHTHTHKMHHHLISFGSRFAVNFFRNDDTYPNVDAPFHFNPRFDDKRDGRVVVRNTHQNQEWGEEERDGEVFPFAQTGLFEVSHTNMITHRQDPAFFGAIFSYHIWFPFTPPPPKKKGMHNHKEIAC